MKYYNVQFIYKGMNRSWNAGKCNRQIFIVMIINSILQYVCDVICYYKNEYI